MLKGEWILGTHKSETNPKLESADPHQRWDMPRRRKDVMLMSHVKDV
jgi:hypothetical protein